MKRLGLLLSLLSVSNFALANANGVTLSAQCSNKIEVDDYFWAGAPADAAPAKIYNFEYIKDDIVSNMGDPGKSACLGELWQKGLDEQADYVGQRLGKAGCTVDDSGAVTGGCDAAKEPVKGLEASDKYVRSLQSDLNKKVRAAMSDAQREEREEMAEAAPHARAPICTKQPNVALTRAEALDTTCCGTSDGKPGGGASSGAIGDLHPDLNYQQCIAKVRPSKHSVLQYGALACIGNGVKGWLSGFWNALKSPFALAGQLWGSRAQLWSLMTDSGARSKFISMFEARIAKLFQDKGQAALCYNAYEKEQATCQFAGEVLGALAAPDALGMVLGMALKPIAAGVKDLDLFLSKNPIGRKALATIKAPARAGKKVWEAGGRAKSAAGRAADKVSPRLRGAADLAGKGAGKLKSTIKKIDEVAGGKAQLAVLKSLQRKISSGAYNARIAMAARLARGTAAATDVAGAGAVTIPKYSRAQLSLAQDRVTNFSDKMNAVSPTTGGAVARASFDGKGAAAVRSEAAGYHHDIEQLEAAGTINPRKAKAPHEQVSEGEALATRTKPRAFTATSKISGEAPDVSPVVPAASSLDVAKTRVDEFTRTLRAERSDAEGRIDPQAARAAFRSVTNKGIRQEALGLQMKTDQLNAAGKISDVDAARIHHEISVAEARARGLKDIPEYVKPADRPLADAARSTRGADEMPVAAAAPSAPIADVQARITRFKDSMNAQSPISANGAVARASFEAKDPVGIHQEAISLHQDVDRLAAEGKLKPKKASQLHETITKGEATAARAKAVEWVTPDSARAAALVDAQKYVDEFSARMADPPTDAKSARAALDVKTWTPIGRARKIRAEAQALRDDVESLRKTNQMTSQKAVAVMKNIDRVEAMALGKVAPATPPLVEPPKKSDELLLTVTVQKAAMTRALAERQIDWKFDLADRAAPARRVLGVQAAYPTAAETRAAADQAIKDLDVDAITDPTLQSDALRAKRIIEQARDYLISYVHGA